MIKNLIKIIEILFNVLLRRGFKNFFHELKDLLFVDLKFNSKTFLRNNEKNLNYVPYYSSILKKNLRFFFYKKTFKDFYFIDLGSGKGRILLSLSDMNFKKIIGVEKNDLFFKESKKYVLKNSLSKKIQIFNNDFLNFKYDFKKNSNIIFFWYGSSSRLVLKKVLVKFKKRFKNNRIYFYIIPENDIPKDIDNIKVLFKFEDFKNDKSRNSKIITLQ